MSVTLFGNYSSPAAVAETAQTPVSIGAGEAPSITVPVPAEAPSAGEPAGTPPANAEGSPVPADVNEPALAGQPETPRDPTKASTSKTATKKPAKQETLQFESTTRGRFDKSEPTIVEGEDLDVPTFLRLRKPN